MVLYTKPNCSACAIVKNLLNEKGIKYDVEDDEKVYMPIARKHFCFQMPFAEIDGEIYELGALREWIDKQ